ncbi:unnamed protein product [Trifolium pratense]|uniref:Uncharacterized protein n=1 Tax=Trifolium pratense TaxID=57577 RepID=A0ACB0LR12_TRIPR|nr:unnamed protein product [Trifolium pratense]
MLLVKQQQHPPSSHDTLVLRCMLDELRDKIADEEREMEYVAQELNDEIQKKEVEVKKLKDEVSEKETKFRKQITASVRRLRAEVRKEKAPDVQKRRVEIPEANKRKVDFDYYKAELEILEAEAERQKAVEADVQKQQPENKVLEA